MPKEVILQQLYEDAQSKKMELRLVINSASVLKRVRSSCVLILDAEKVQDVLCTMRQAGISYRILYANDKKSVVMFYHRNMLEAQMRKSEVREYLTKFDYPQETLEEDLERFQRRMEQYYENGEEFPHEMGIFLEYPLEDVESFIKNDGKNYLLSGYWKVYSQPERAKQTFRRMDAAKDIAVEEWFRGKKIYEIAC